MSTESTFPQFLLHSALTLAPYRLKFLASLRDVQTLGIVACMLEMCTRGELT